MTTQSRSDQFEFGNLLEFRSTAFPPQAEDGDLVNEGMHGYALAAFLAVSLRVRGFAVGTPIAEDWGWYVPLDNKGFELAFGCNAIGEHDFLVQTIPSTPTIRSWFRKIDTAGPVRAMADAIYATLAESGKVTIGPAWVSDLGSSFPD